MSLPSALITRLSAKQTNPFVSISRPTASKDSSGTPSLSYSTVASNVRAVVNIRSGAEALRYGRESNRRFGQVLFHTTVDVREQDRIIHGSKTYDVQSVRVPGDRASTDRLSYKICEVEETL